VLTDFNDLGEAEGRGAVAAVIEEALQVTQKARQKEAGEGWPDPIPPGQMPVPDIPVDVLPTWVRDMAGAVAASTQTPPALSVMVALSVLASCLHRRFEVAPWGPEDDYTEPVNLWTLTGLPAVAAKRRSSMP